MISFSATCRTLKEEKKVSNVEINIAKVVCGVEGVRCLELGYAYSYTLAQYLPCYVYTVIYFNFREICRSETPTHKAVG